MRTFGSADLTAAMRAYQEALGRHQAVLNRLNVFPVPDGDTGTNMLLTIEAVIAELEERAGEGAPMALVCEAIAHGSLMGARGNSGVILCQILRGMATTLGPLEEAGGPELALAFDLGSRSAREAVLRPAEGTILTVAKEAAAAALSVSDDGLVDVLEAAQGGAVRALWATPSQLAVLAEAGVVDAGGAGLVLLYDALLSAVDGRALPAELELPREVAALVAAGTPIVATPLPTAEEGVSADGSPRYEVMFFLDAEDGSIPAFKDVWSGIGDSIVVVGGEGVWNCHIHTDDVGGAIEAGIDVGRPHTIRVTDLTTQVEEERWVRDAGPLVTPANKAPVTAVLAVAHGEGIGRIFHSLGAQHLVDGGQSMNPSTRDLLEAIDASPAEEVVVLPNNANIVPVANEAAKIANKPVRVVPTAGIQEGLAALLGYDPEAGGKENEESMARSAERVVAGEVTQAVRATSSSVGEVAAGDFIGLSRGGIESVGTDLAGATIALLSALLRPGSEIVTLLEGDGATPAETRRVTEWLAFAHPKLAVELHHGGQRLYPYLISIE